jgi:hypothetical protein
VDHRVDSLETQRGFPVATGHRIVIPDRDNLKTRKDLLRQAAEEVVRGRPGVLRSRKLAVAEEMLRAREATQSRALDPMDPRWMLACATRDSLQGAVLTYESRRKLMRLAQRVGIRAFDANLIVAIVQDRARRGEPIESAAEALSVIPRPAARRASVTAWVWGAAILVAVLVDAVLIGWLILQ